MEKMSIIKGEGRVLTVKPKVAFLGTPNVNGKICMLPTSLKQGNAHLDLTEYLQVNDVVTFEAASQVERNGVKYLAVDGSVVVKKRAAQLSTIEGDGVVVNLDTARGCFGFVASDIVENIFFNVSVVRPKCDDVHKVLANGKKVHFRAVANEINTKSTSKWRATLVCPAAKAAEYANPNPKTRLVSESSTSEKKNSVDHGSRFQSLRDGGSSSDDEWPFDAVEPPCVVASDNCDSRAEVFKWPVGAQYEWKEDKNVDSEVLGDLSEEVDQQLDKFEEAKYAEAYEYHSSFGGNEWWQTLATYSMLERYFENLANRSTEC